MASRAVRAAALLVLGLAPACRHLAGPPGRIRECPGALASTAEMGGDFLTRQRVRVVGEGVELRLSLAVQKRGDRLVAVGFDPVGARLFTIVQSGLETQVDSLPAEVLPFPPLNLLRDLHRIRFLAAGAPPGGDGASTRLRDGEQIRESWSGGALRWRSFERVDGAPSGAVLVAFPTPEASDAVTSARVDNGWCGYTASFETLSEQPLR